LEAVALVAVVLLFLRRQHATEAATTVERRELLTRIQRPELIPVGHNQAFDIPDPEPDEFDMVGEIFDAPKED
jgi:hypothetical protein